MKKFFTILSAVCLSTAGLSADAGRDKCPCDDYSNVLAQVDPNQVYYVDQPSAPASGTISGYNMAVIGAGAVLVGAIAAAIILSDNDGHSHSH